MSEISQEQRGQQTVDQEYQDILFGVRLSVRYHTRRRLFFESIEQWTNGLSVVFGSATFAAVFSQTSKLAMFTGVLTSIFSAINVVMGPSKKARRHSDLARDFIDLEMDMLKHPEKPLNEFKAQRLTIEAGEPTTLGIVYLLAHNELSQSMIGERANLYDIKWHVRWSAHLGNIFNDQKIKLQRQPLPPSSPQIHSNQ